MTYIDFTMKQIQELGGEHTGVPIFTADIAGRIAAKYGLDYRKAAAAANTAMNRIMKRNLYPDLRRHTRGIYYVTHQREGWETGINPIELTRRKYLDHDNGYQTDDWELMRLGLTDQCPNKVTIATNAVRGGLRYDEDCDVYVRAPKTRITAENKRYLQFLDILTCMDGALVTNTDPEKMLVKFVTTYHLNGETLLAYAEKYYTVKAAQMAAEIGEKAKKADTG